MPFGELFTGTFGQIWRHKRLWLFGLFGLALTSIGLLIYQVFQYRWQGEWFSMMGDMTQNLGQMPDWYFSNMLSTMVWLWVGMGVWMVVGLLGYIVNLVMRGATMNEAAVAWGGGRTQTGRGLAAGTGRAAYVFVLDLLWLLPGLLLACGGLAAFAVLIAAAAAAAEGGDDAAGILVLAIIGGLCCVFCLALFVGLLSTVFAPLMYQSVVAGRRGLGAAIGEGWRMAKANLGAMIIFAILLWVLNIALGMLVSLFTLPFMLPWIGSWMQDWGAIMESASRGMPPQMPQFGNMGWLLVATLVSGVLTWLTSSFMQSFRLTLYAGVYRHLGGRSEAVEPAPFMPPVDGAASVPLMVVAPLATEAGDLTPAQPVELAEITVPDEVVEPVEVTPPHV
jgi:hypothetical protein